MADFNTLRESILASIKENGNEEITGSVLQTILTSIVNEVETATGETPAFWINDNRYLAVGKTGESSGEGSIANIDLSDLFTGAKSGSNTTTYTLTITIAGETKTISLYSATAENAGIMSAEDKTKLDNLATYNSGHNDVSTLVGIPVDKRLVVATVSESGTLSLGDDMVDGRELHIIINNSGSEAITVTLPNAETLEIADDAYGEVNILYDGATYYYKSA